MLNCKQLTELATSYTEGALDPATSRSIEAHLATCQGCRTWLEQLALTARLVRSIPQPEVTAEARDASHSAYRPAIRSYPSATSFFGSTGTPAVNPTRGAG